MSIRATALAPSFALAAGLFTFGAPNEAEACGCFSPPEPTSLSGDEFVVNQQAEQIIFEVDEVNQEITAHVLIQYAGEPEGFAWIVPVPDVPDLGITPALTFALLDSATAPSYRVSTANRCPDQEWMCQRHAECDWGDTAGGSDGNWSSGGTTAGTTGSSGGFVSSDMANSPLPPPVDVEDQQVVGGYEVTTLSATSAQDLADWLVANGYFVSPEAAPYMQPYLDAGMKFVAAKLVPGAGVDQIAPLRMTFPGTQPMIPLQLTAVAAEPRMAVRAYIYGSSQFELENGTTLTDLDPELLEDFQGEHNAPFVFSRTIDEVEGPAFLREWAGGAPLPAFPDDAGCCGDPSDFCGIGDNYECNCPGDAWDAQDCAEITGLVESYALMQDLASRHERLTRLTTRVSWEDMTFDPLFRPTADASDNSSANAERVRYAGCNNAMVEQAAYDAAMERLPCSQVYCGAGECVITGDDRAACDCDDGFAVREYTELDGSPSFTCVPDQGPLDFGPDAPNPCAAVDCGMGSCVDVGGVAACACEPGMAAWRFDGSGECQPAVQRSGDAGAGAYSESTRDMDVCSPLPPTCGADEWLVPLSTVPIRGVACANNQPTPEQLEVKPDPCVADPDQWPPGTPGSTDPARRLGCACAVGGTDGPAGAIGFAGLVGLLGFGLRRRRRRD